jgi:hypothetical protein
MIKPKSLKDAQWQKNEGGKLQRRPKATFDILMAKYKEGRVGVMGCKNRMIQNTKLDNQISLSRASSFAARRSSGKQSRTRNTKSQNVGVIVNKSIIRRRTFGRATNAWAVGASADDEPTLSSLGRVVRSVDTTTNTLSDFNGQASEA